MSICASCPAASLCILPLVSAFFRAMSSSSKMDAIMKAVAEESASEGQALAIATVAKQRGKQPLQPGLVSQTGSQPLQPGMVQRVTLQVVEDPAPTTTCVAASVVPPPPPPGPPPSSGAVPPPPPPGPPPSSSTVIWLSKQTDMEVDDGVSTAVPSEAESSAGDRVYICMTCKNEVFKSGFLFVDNGENLQDHDWALYLCLLSFCIGFSSFCLHCLASVLGCLASVLFMPYHLS